MTPSLPYTINPGTNSLTLGGGSGGVVIGGTAGSGNIQVYSSTGNITSIRETSTTNSTIGVGITARSTGTPAAGFGPKLNFYSESNNTLDRDAGVIEWPWTTATDGTRTTDGVFSTVNSGTTAEAFRIYGNKRAMVGGGTNQASAAFQVNSTTGGFLGPKGTDAEMLAIATPTEGLEFWNTTIKGKCVFNGTDWERLSCAQTPTVTVGGGAGGGASASVVGNDLAGVITITCGTSPTANSTVVTLDFHTDYDLKPRAVTLTGANENAVLILYQSGFTRTWYCDESAITVDEFIIKSGSVNNSAVNGSVYKIFYNVGQ